ncbi:MAG: TetR/AcrR family transcriptional regulator [Microscillaceae bacterium]|jgi:TetR/AcrR family transcriptional repressor of nem operon|nr:TetR/AcrR family transcriptional regulator [Microscillaceae bacterium]
MPIQKITKAEILTKTLELFQKQGYYQTSMEQIAEACQLKKGSFYYYFKDGKEEIMHEVLQMSLDFFREKVFAIATQADLNPPEKLEKILKKHIRLLIKYKSGCLFGKTSLEIAHQSPSFKPVLQTFFEEWENSLSQIYEAKYQPSYAKQLAKQTMIEMQGASILMQVFDNEEIMNECCARLLDKF